MEVYKFGGASVKDAHAIQNVLKVLQSTQVKDVIIVVSAMGKTTNALEAVVAAYFDKDQDFNEPLARVWQYHKDILDELFPVGHAIFALALSQINLIKDFLGRNKSPHYDFVYDQVVSHGEIMSTLIIHWFLKENGFCGTWIDIRENIKTNAAYREGKVDWETTRMAIKKSMPKSGMVITQGFIASDGNGFTTTLGREGSDYTGAIIAYCLDAKSLTIWKDVPGVLSADPRYFDHARLLNTISYEEAIELAFYGASVIHPKTIQPLKRKEIPLYVKPFLAPAEKGTCVMLGEDIEPLTPCYILKKNQVLIALSSLDFSFMMEDNIGEVFKLLGRYGMKVDLIQNSAISFSVCVDNKFGKLDELIAHLRANFHVDVMNPVNLYTVRHADVAAVRSLENRTNVLLKQQTGRTLQMVIGND